jgi:malonyl-CoA/methylmalonyl-CoA synthetase
MLPTHHAAGLIQNALPSLMGGGTVEFTMPKFDAAAVWKRIKLGGVNSISAVPTIYVRLLQYYETKLSKLGPAQKEAYRSAMGDVEQFQSGTSALPTSVSSRWTELFGRRILERYGGTEFGNPYANYPGSKLVLVCQPAQTTTLLANHTQQGSAGLKNPGIESYLANGNQGEIFARSPLMFSKQAQE